jgi:tetratricopeptide (TPR) repeat protein
VHLWIGDLANAGKLIDRFISCAETYSLGPYIAVGRGLKGELAIRQGDAKSGVEGVQACLEKLHAARYELLTTAFKIAIVRGLAAMGRFDEGLALTDETIGLVDANGDAAFTPELLRLKGSLLLSKPQPRVADVQSCLAQSLELSRRQGARAWELRTATDLASLLASQGRRENARAILRPVFDQFVEGFDTADLMSAGRLLKTLS